MAKKPQAAPKATPRRTGYEVANLTAGAIIIPRIPETNQPALTKNSPIVIPAGQSTTIPATDWEVLRKNKGVMNYLDAGLLREVKREGQNYPQAERTVDLTPPDHLLRDDEQVQGKNTATAATVRRRNASTIDINAD